MSEAQALTNINVALWIIAILAILGTVALVVTLCFLIKLMNRVMVLVDEVKAQTKVISQKVDPLVDTAIETFNELKATSIRLNNAANKFVDATKSVGNFLSFFNIFKGLTPSENNKGLISGILSGVSIFSGLIKANKAKKEKKKQELVEAEASKGENNE
ncbi:MAG: hypothetical protein IJS60_09205 [Abditibacteriota bacterium]|nr:hypothetical protein [Abditibacteriota bacterium]